jgi:hypothetical protein
MALPASANEAVVEANRVRINIMWSKNESRDRFNLLFGALNTHILTTKMWDQLPLIIRKRAGVVWCKMAVPRKLRVDERSNSWIRVLEMVDGCGRENGSGTGGADVSVDAYGCGE